MANQKEVTIPELPQKNQIDPQDSFIITSSTDGKSSRIVAQDLIDQISIRSNKIDVFLAVGQSNMEGASEGLTLSPAPIDGNFKFFNGNIVANSDPQMPGGTKGSALPSFGNTYKQITDRNVCIVNASVGGSAMVPSSDGASLGNWDVTGTLFNLSITKLNAALAKLQQLGYTYKIKGILWCQGESDGAAINNGITTEAEYKTALQNMITRYRTQLSIPALPFYIFRTGVFNSIGPFDTFKKVREQQEIVARDFAETFIVYRNAVDFGTTDRNLLNPDGLHYVQIAYNEMGYEGATNIATNTFPQKETDSTGLNVLSSPLKGLEQSSHVLTNRKPFGVVHTLTIDQNSTAAYTAYLLSVYEKAPGSGGKYLFDYGLNTLPDGQGTHTTKIRGYADGTFRIASHFEPFNNTVQNVGSSSNQFANVIAAVHKAIASISVEAGATASNIIFKLGNTYEFGRFMGGTGNLLVHESADVPSSAFTVGGKKTDFPVKGSIPFPRMTRNDRMALPSPVQGLHVYQTDTASGDNEGVYVYKSSGWVHAY